VLGDFNANLRKVRDFSLSSRKSQARNSSFFPEMVDTGYSMPVIQKHAKKMERRRSPLSCQKSRKRSFNCHRRWNFGP